MKKKFLSVLLTLVMVLTMIPMATGVAFAGEGLAITNGTPESDKDTNHGYIEIDKNVATNGEIVTITVISKEGYQLKSLTCVPTDFVDLGIKDTDGKSLYWAKSNLGATLAYDSGDYYMWGATALMYSEVDRTKSEDAFTFKSENPYGDNYKNTWMQNKGFNWENIPFAIGTYTSAGKNVFTKYTKSADYAKNSIDNYTTLESGDDAATAINSSWHMPTKDNFISLVENCVLIWTNDYGGSKSGYIVYKAKNENDKGKAKINGTWKKWDSSSSNYVNNTDGSEPTDYNTDDTHIFLPFTGYGSTNKLQLFDSNGSYWTSTLDSTQNQKAYALGININTVGVGANDRRNGYSVRPVMSDPEIRPEKQDNGTHTFCMKSQDITVTATFEEKQNPIPDPAPSIGYFVYDVAQYNAILAEAQKQQALIDAQQAGTKPAEPTAEPTAEKLTAAEAKALVETMVSTVRTENQARGIKVFVKDSEEVAKFKAAGYKVLYDFYRAESKAVPSTSDYKITTVVNKEEPWYLNTAAKKGKKYYYKAVAKVYDADGELVAETKLTQGKYGVRTR